MTNRRKKRVRVYITVSGIAMMMFAVLYIISLQTSERTVKDNTIVQYVFTQIVEQHRETVQLYAKEHGIEEYTDVLLAIILQESGGRGADPMQSSESLCGEVGCISDARQSIEQGVHYFAAALEKAGGDLPLAVQSYNFGLGFIDYVQKNDGEFSDEIVIEFSKMMYEQADDPTKYSCLREEAKQYNACYGDILYAEEVLSYKQKFAEKVE